MSPSPPISKSKYVTDNKPRFFLIDVSFIDCRMRFFSEKMQRTA